MSPWAPLRPCCTVGCRELIRGHGGHCDTHRRQRERERSARRRASDHEVYTHDWQRFRERFFSNLLASHIVPECGAVLPGGPTTTDSECKRDGIPTFDQLELDHAWPLTLDERAAAAQGDRRAVDDPLRCQLLCRTCHSKKTAREQPAGRRW